MTSTGGVTDPSFLVYEPGVRLNIDMYSGKLARIDSLWLGEPTAVPIMQYALASHAISATHDVEPDPAVRKAVAQSSDGVAFV